MTASTSSFTPQAPGGAATDGRSRRHRVAFVVSDLGLGGTAKGAVSLVTRLNRDRFHPEVLCLDSAGPREAEVRGAGLEVRVKLRDLDTLSAALEGVSVVHVVRHGIAEPVVPEAVRRAGVPVLIETNIFGAVDRSRDEARFACHLFISQMCLMRYRGWVRGAERSFHQRHRVGFLPVESRRLRALASSPAESRIALGLDPGRPVVARVGRSADLKWRTILIEMIPYLRKLVPEVQVLLVGATDAKRALISRHGLERHVQLLEPMADEAQLACVYAAADVVVSAAAIGESQGVALAEALALERPVVTCSTPWVDNAQVEWVQNGRTGWLADHPRPFAEAVADLIVNPSRRALFGRAGRALVDERLDPDRLGKQLEGLYLHHLEGAALEWSPSETETTEFERAYVARSSARFRRLRLKERAQARETRARERVQRTALSTRMVFGQMRRRS